MTTKTMVEGAQIEDEPELLDDLIAATVANAARVSEADGVQRGWEFVPEGKATTKAVMPEGSSISGVSRNGKRYGVIPARDSDGVLVMTHRMRSKSYATLDDIPTEELEAVDESG